MAQKSNGPSILSLIQRFNQRIEHLEELNEVLDDYYKGDETKIKNYISKKTGDHSDGRYAKIAGNEISHQEREKWQKAKDNGTEIQMVKEEQREKQKKVENFAKKIRDRGEETKDSYSLLNHTYDPFVLRDRMFFDPNRNIEKRMEIYMKYKKLYGLNYCVKMCDPEPSSQTTSNGGKRKRRRKSRKRIKSRKRGKSRKRRRKTKRKRRGEKRSRRRR